VNDSAQTPGDEGTSTSLSLLERACARENGAWEQLARLCKPLVLRWCRQRSLRDEDFKDVFQDVMKKVLVALPRFRREKSGAFRCWLKTITRHRITDFQRRLEKQPAGEGGSSAQERINEVPDGANEDAALEPEEEGILFRRALDMIRSEFNEEYWRAFELVVFETRGARDAAEAMRVDPDFIYQAKSRILRRLRQEFEGLLPE
jgi:RNA polymerase sigma-70 factor (ECF subfamily)